MPTLDLFLPLAKVDVDQRLVQGLATAEVADRAGEICDYASTKPYYEAWSAEMSAGERRQVARRLARDARAGRRGQDHRHRLRRRRASAFWSAAQDRRRRGMAQGRGRRLHRLQPGRRYVRRWADPETSLTRYTAEPSEISLVDLPCVPGATFEVIKDGVAKRRAFAARAEAPEPDAPDEPQR